MEKKYMIEDYEDFTIYKNGGGAHISVGKHSGVEILEIDGFIYKDLNKNGILDDYENWQLPMEERIADLIEQMTIEEIAGLMLYSSHQSISAKGLFGKMFAGTYNDKALAESEAKLSDLTDQQKAYLDDEKLRHVLLTAVDSPEIAATWNNNLQAYAESSRLGIPVNISSDPRHTAQANTEFNAGSGGDISKWPEPLGLAATFNPRLVHRFGQIAANEYRSLGITTALSPQVDIATEPRWMRFDGTFGEDAKLSSDIAQAYCEGFQTSDTKTGWGLQSVNTMVKHWPGGGSGEAGRDAHYAYGKYAVYPGNNFDEHLKPFLDGAFNLGKTKKASAVMPYYTISYNQTDDNVGNGFNKTIIQDMLRDTYGYDDVVCTDWAVTADSHDFSSFLSGKSWGMEQESVVERHYKALMAGCDQFGGNNELQPVLEAFALGVVDHGKEWMLERFKQSGKRLLRNIFRTGLFEDPYLDPTVSALVCGHPKYMAEGYRAQLQSIVMLKNKANIIPQATKRKVYIPMRHRLASHDWFGNVIPATSSFPVSKQIVEQYYQLVDEPGEADFAICFIESPQTVGYKADVGYLPISLQYRPYTATYARVESLAGGDYREATDNRSYYLKTNQAANETDLDGVLETKKAIGDKPVIVCIDAKNPTIVEEFETQIDGLFIHFGATTQALLDIISGKEVATGLLPFQMPATMQTVEQQQEDVAHDMQVHVDACGHAYDFAYGLTDSGRIDDTRVQTYRHNK